MYRCPRGSALKTDLVTVERSPYVANKRRAAADFQDGAGDVFGILREILLRSSESIFSLRPVKIGIGIRRLRSRFRCASHKQHPVAPCTRFARARARQPPRSFAVAIKCARTARTVAVVGRPPA